MQQNTNLFEDCHAGSNTGRLADITFHLGKYSEDYLSALYGASFEFIASSSTIWNCTRYYKAGRLTER